MGRYDSFIEKRMNYGTVENYDRYKRRKTDIPKPYSEESFGGYSHLLIAEDRGRVYGKIESNWHEIYEKSNVDPPM